MVLGMLAGGALSVGLAFPTGLLFGQGYGLGVRQGYHSFQPSKSDTTKALHTGLDPLQGAKGAGLLSAEERTGVPALDSKAGTPSIIAGQDKLLGGATSSKPWSDAGYLQNKAGQWRKRESFKSHEEFQEWMNLTTTNYKRKKLGHR